MTDIEPLDLGAIEAILGDARAGRSMDVSLDATIRLLEREVPALVAEVRRLRDRTGEWEYGILTVWTEGKEVADDSDWWGGSEREVTLASYERNRRDERFGNPWRSVVVRRIQAGPIERVKVSA